MGQSPALLIFICEELRENIGSRMSLLSCPLNAPIPSYNPLSLSLPTVFKDCCSNGAAFVLGFIVLVSREALGRSRHICHQFLYCKRERITACIQRKVMMKLKCDGAH